MYTTRTSKNKTLYKANGNYKPYPLRGKKNAIRKAAKASEYNNDPKNAQDIKDKRIRMQVAFDARKAAKIAAGWTPKDNSHYLEYVTKNKSTKTLYTIVGDTLKAESKRRIEQSKQDIANFKAEQAKWKEEYVPTGNKADNPAFNGIGNRRPNRGSIVAAIKAGTYWRYNKKKRSPKALHGAEKRYERSLTASKFKLRREMLLLDKQDRQERKFLAIKLAIEANDAIRNAKKVNCVKATLQPQMLSNAA